MSRDQTSSESPPGIYAAMVAIMADIKPIDKAQQNREQHFRYRGIDDVYNMLQPLMARHGVFMTINVRDRQVCERSTKAGNAMQCVALIVDYAFYHTDGSYVECTVMGEGRDMADKATNKAMAAAHKYALLQTFCIPTDGQDDPDQETPEALVPEQQGKMRKRRAPAQQSYDLAHIASDMATKCSTPDELKAYFASLRLSVDHPQRQAIINLMVEAKTALDARKTDGRTDGSALITSAQLKALQAHYSHMGFDRDQRLAHMTEYFGHPVDSSKHLTRDEASQLLDDFNRQAPPQDDKPDDYPF